MEYNYFPGCPRSFSMDDDYSYASESEISSDDSDETCESVSELDSMEKVEKVYVCDYDKIYISIYDDIEKYRALKQSKKKNISSNWNDVNVILPDGKKTNIKNAPEILYKNVNGTSNNVEQPTEQVENVDDSIQAKPIVVVTNNHKIPSAKEKNEINSAKKETQPNKEIKVEKLSKKKLKKQRQKEKKEKQNQVEKTKDVKIEKSEEVSKANSKTNHKSKDNCKNEDDHDGPISNNNNNNNKSKLNSSVNSEKTVTEMEETDDTGDEQNLLDENTAFISNALKKSEKKESAKAKKNVESKAEKNKKSTIKPNLPKENVTVKKDIPKPVPLLSLPMNLPSTSGFQSTSSTMKKSKPTATDYKESIALGKKAVCFLMANEIKKAIQFLNESINLNAHELRHYLNRSFCFLRLGEYRRSLKDSEFVIMTTHDSELLVTAKFRAGQAYCGLQNFKEAEKNLNEAHNLHPTNSAVFEELLRVKVLQLLSMGFHERDILEIFYQCPSVEPAISLLAEKTHTEECNDFILKNEDEIDVYNSDDEDSPCLTRLFRKLSNYQQSFIKKATLPTPSPAKTVPQPVKIPIIKTVAAIPAKLSISKDVNDKAIWIGNTTSSITDASIKKVFARFGKIDSIYRKPNENYTFINYKDAISVRDLLAANQYVEVDNVKLPIKSATRK